MTLIHPEDAFIKLWTDAPDEWVWPEYMNRCANRFMNRTGTDFECSRLAVFMMFGTEMYKAKRYLKFKRRVCRLVWIKAELNSLNSCIEMALKKLPLIKFRVEIPGYEDDENFCK